MSFLATVTLKRMWDRLSLLGKIGLVVGSVLALLQGIEFVCVRLGLITGDPGGNPILIIWNFLKEFGIVGGLTKFVWDSLTAAPDSPAETTTGESQSDVSGAEVPRPEAEPGILFVGLNFRQWFFTLSVLFPTVMLSGVVTAFVSGGKSVWVTFPALCIIGLSLAFVSGVDFMRKNTKSLWGVLIGISPFALALTTCCCIGPMSAGLEAERTKGQQASMLNWVSFFHWILLVYSLLLLLPCYQLIEVIRPGTPKFRNSFGTWIAFSYLALVVVLGSVIPIITNQPGASTDAHPTANLVAPDPRFIGDWTKPDEIDTRGGRAAPVHFLATITPSSINWSGMRGNKTSRYRWIKENEVQLLDAEGAPHDGKKKTVIVRLDFISPEEAIIVIEGVMWMDHFADFHGKFRKK